MHDVPASGVDASDNPTGPVDTLDVVTASVRSGTFADSLEQFGSRPALIAADGEVITYVELALAADTAPLPPARCLIALPMAATPQAIVLYLAALRRRYPVILLDAPDSVVGQRISETYEPWLPGDRAPAMARVAPHPDLAVLLSTSGTTGSPKLVRLSAANIDANARSIGKYLAIDADTRAITSLPLHYSYGLSVLNSHLAAGASVVLTEHSVNTPAFWALFDAQQVSSIAGVPFSYELFDSVGLRDRALPSLKVMTQAGGRLPPEAVATWGAWAAGRGIKLFIMYGQTEATARMAYLPPDRLKDHPDCIGVPIPGGSFSLVDDNGGIIEAEGETGELVYHGPNVMMGYGECPADLAKAPELDSLHTGDLAERTAAGLYRIVGRRSRFVKPYGLRVSLDEIEGQLARQGIAAFVTGADDLIAVAFTGDAITAGSLTAQLAERYKLPAPLFDVTQLAALPHLPTGKRDYPSVLRAARQRQAAAPKAESFLDVFMAVLSRANIGFEDSFNSLGGDSLSYVNVVTAIDKRLGHVPLGWEDLTIAQLDLLAVDAATRAKPFIKLFDAEIILRALAIMAVVLTHARFRVVAGGSDALMILAGFSLARFNFSRLVAGNGWQVLRAFAGRVVLPYYLIFLAYVVLNRNPGWPSFLLISNAFGRFKSFLSPYWFIEALAQAMVVMVVLFLIPAVRRWAQAAPASFGIALLFGAVAVDGALFSTFHHAYLNNFSLDSVFPLFALGWLIFFAREIWLKILCLAAAALLAMINADIMAANAIFGGWGFDVGIRRAFWILAAPIVLLFVPRIPLPRLLGQGLASIAAVAFTIYLTHMFPVQYLARKAELPAMIALIGAIALGFALTGGLRQLRKWPFIGRWIDKIAGRESVNASV